MAPAIYMDGKLLAHMMKIRLMIGIIIDNEDEIDDVVRNHVHDAWDSLNMALGWSAQ